jgi:hypothetical protein
MLEATGRRTNSSQEQIPRYCENGWIAATELIVPLRIVHCDAVDILIFEEYIRIAEVRLLCSKQSSAYVPACVHGGRPNLGSFRKTERTASLSGRIPALDKTRRL